jgi:hypothetical protein
MPITYQCQFCLKHFNEKPNLLRHTNTVHLKPKQFQCELCSKHFSQQSNLIRHKQKFSCHTNSFRKEKDSSDFEESKSPPKNIQKDDSRDMCSMKTMEIEIFPYEKNIANPPHDTEQENFKEIEAKVQRFSCHICELDFAVRENLKFHVENDH